jgi:hypothetical protein
MNLLDNNHFLKMLYPATDPSLDAIGLREVSLNEDRVGGVLLRFDLSEYPASPPAKWHPEFNKVQLRIVGIGVRHFVLTGGVVASIGRLTIGESAGGVAVDFDGGGCQIRSAFDFLRVDRVTAYTDGKRSGD